MYLGIVIDFDFTAVLGNIGLDVSLGESGLDVVLIVNHCQLRKLKCWGVEQQCGLSFIPLDLT